MALRIIRTYGDDLLRKKSRPVDEVTERIRILIKDMIETMRSENGVGLAAAQVGILKRIFIVDILDGNGIRVFINPEILEKQGTQKDIEGCLSIPGTQEEVERPNKIKVKALNENGEEFIIEADGFLARAICHENDHLDGVLFVDHVK